MVVELNARGRRCPAENGLARDGPDALFSALLNEDERIGRDAQQAVCMSYGAATSAKVVDRHLPANSAGLDAIREETRFKPLLFPAAECQDGKLGSAV